MTLSLTHRHMPNGHLLGNNNNKYLLTTVSRWRNLKNSFQLENAYALLVGLSIVLCPKNKSETLIEIKIIVQLYN